MLEDGKLNVVPREIVHLSYTVLILLIKQIISSYSFWSLRVLEEKHKINDTNRKQLSSEIWLLSLHIFSKSNIFPLFAGTSMRSFCHFHSNHTVKYGKNFAWAPWAKLCSLAETPQLPPPHPPHLGSYTRVLLVSQSLCDPSDSNSSEWMKTVWYCIYSPNLVEWAAFCWKISSIFCFVFI